MVTKYRVCGTYADKIEVLDIERETECFVVFKSGRKEAKSSDYYNWFNTELEAKEFVIGIMSSKHESIQRHIDQYKKELELMEKKIQQYLEDNPELVVG